MAEALLAQALGGLSLVVSVLGYLRPGRARFLRFSALSMACVSLSLWLSDAVPGAVLGIAGAFCCFVASTLRFEGSEILRRTIFPTLMTIAAAGYLSVAGLEWAGFGGLLLGCFVVGRISDWMPTDAGVRWALLPVMMVWLTYSVVEQAWGAATGYALLTLLNAAMLLCRKNDVDRRGQAAA